MMRILLVGGNSSLASVLKRLLAEFAEVITGGRNGCDVCLDLAEPVLSFNITSGFDAVINCAAQFDVKRSEEMIQVENVNVLGTLKLCHACKMAEAGQFVHVSSIFASLDQMSPFFSMYALSKKHADEVAQLYALTHNLPLLIIRSGQLYCVGDAQRKSQPFLYSIMDKAQYDQAS
jgi:nucleoside-diphosphate-sugar epimerase